MQSLSSSQRSMQRKPPVVDTSHSSQANLVNASPSQSTAGPRTSSGSSRSSTYRRQNSNQQLSQIEKSVTHLLIATKQLLETLTQWSRHTATEIEVSDVYVRLGYEFNIACRAFTSIGVDTADLGPVPELLRAILEETLSQEASSASLDRFLPRIRDIIITLLHGLKRKQQKLRSRQGKDNPSSTNTLTSSGSSGNLNTGLNQILDDVPSRTSSGKGSERRIGSGGSTLTGESNNGDILVGEEHGVPPRVSSMHPSRQNSSNISGLSSGRIINQENQIQHTVVNPDSIPMMNLPHASPIHSLRSDLERPPSQSMILQKDGTAYPPPPPPPPPPKQQDALAQLQRGGDLERRASRRYSAYQISKHLGASPSGVSMLPPAQNSLVPNRGRDVRESMNAVRVRGSGIHSRPKSTNPNGEPSPIRGGTFAQRISEEGSRSGEGIKVPAELPAEDSPLTKTPEDKLGADDRALESYHLRRGGELSERPSTDNLGLPKNKANRREEAGPTLQAGVMKDTKLDLANSVEAHPPASVDSTQVDQYIPEQSPQPHRDFTLFLQYKSKIKKFVLPEGPDDLSIARLQLAFIEKFAWNIHNNGIELPEIYVQDPVSGVRHELEDLNDVKDRSVLVLNMEVLDEVKRHVDEGLGNLRRMIEGIRTTIDGQHTVIQQVSDNQQLNAKELARLARAPKPDALYKPSADKIKFSGQRLTSTSKDTPIQLTGIQSLRQDLAIVRQTFSSLTSEIQSSVLAVNEKASSMKAILLDGTASALDSSSGRSYVNSGKKFLGEESEKIVNRVDDLQDVVEDLRKDVVTRGVRPLPRQLELVSKSISGATADLKKMQEYLKREKPIWTKIWEKELSLVCNDRDLLTMQEELAADLEDDLEKATQTFALVEQATKQQTLQPGQGSNSVTRTASRGLTAIALDQDVDLVKAKDGVLGEVRALQPNHETRLEAIQRAEKARQRELETRQEGGFKKELGSFVEEGKLKKSGGVEEAERLRRAKDDLNRREAWDNQHGTVLSNDAVTENPVSAPEQRSSSPDRESETSQEATLTTSQEQRTENGKVDSTDDGAPRAQRSSWLPSIFTG